MITRIITLCAVLFLSMTQVYASVNNSDTQSPLHIELIDDQNEPQILIRGFNPQNHPVTQAASYRGVMFVIEGARIQSGRIRAKDKRLDFIQTSDKSDRAIIRVVQHKNRRGSLSEFLETRESEDGLRLYIRSKKIAKDWQNIILPQTQIVEATPPPTDELEAQLAKLEPPPVVQQPPSPKPAEEDNEAPPSNIENPIPQAHSAELNDEEQALIDAISHSDTAISKSTTAPPTDEPQSSTWLSPSTGLLVLVVLLPYVGFYVLWKRQAFTSNTKTSERFRVLQQHHISPKQKLLAVDFRDHTYLLGVTEQNIQMLTQSSDTKIANFPSASPANDISKRTLSLDIGNTPQGSDPPVNNAAIQDFKNRLKDALSNEMSGQYKSPATLSPMDFNRPDDSEQDYG